MTQNKMAEPTTPKKSRLSRNLKLLKENPRLFFRKLITWIKPMRKDYRRRWNHGMRWWLRWYLMQLQSKKVSWMGIKAQKMVLDCWVYQQIIHERSEEHTSELQSLRHLVCRL